MRIHLYATDVSALDLVTGIPVEVTAVIVPENRAATDKVRVLREAATAPVFIQPRGAAPDGLPPAEAALVWMYSQIFPPAVLSLYPRGLLNMHGGHIPRYRGASVLHWAIINGETELGVTWHRIVAEVDAGPIWAESALPVGPDETAWDVRARMIAEGVRLLPDAWTRMRDDRPLRLPDLSTGRVWPQRRPADGRLGMGWPERRVRDLVRALCPPWPAAVLAADGGVEATIRAVVEQPTATTLPYVTAEGRVLHLLPA